MSKKFKKVNEEVAEVKANEEVTETQEEVVEAVEEHRFNLKTIGKIAIVTLTVVAGAIIAIGLGFGNNNDTAEITTDENGDIVIHDNANDSDAENKDE